MKTVAIIAFLTLTTINVSAQLWVNRLDSVMTILEKQELFHGQILIAEKGKILFNDAYNNYRDKPITTKTMLPIASVSKPITALGIMLLKEQGKLNYDDKVKEYLPQIPYEDITIRHLLTQTSGIPNFLSVAINYADTTKLMGKEEILNLISEIKPKSDQVGKKFFYNNSNYFLLRCIIETVSEKSYDDFMMHNIWKPLEMNHTLGYSHIETTDKAEITIDNFYNSGGGIQSTAEDLFRFAEEFNRKRLISPESVEIAFSRPLLKNGEKSQYGFGWYILETPDNKSVGHWGGGEAVKAYLELYLSEEKVLIMLNVESHIYADETYSMIRNIWESKPYKLPQEKVQHFVDQTIYQEYIGSYLTPNMGLLHISIENNELYVRPDPIPGKEKLIPSSDSTFYFKNQNLKWQFYRDKEGEVIGFGLQGNKNNMGVRQE